MRIRRFLLTSTYKKKRHCESQDLKNGPRSDMTTKTHAKTQGRKERKCILGVLATWRDISLIINKIRIIVISTKNKEAIS